jgi:uncharacterized membrane protein
MMIPENPKLHASVRPIDWLIEVIAVIMLLCTIAYTLLEFNSLPDRIPRHFDAAGSPDGFGNKGVILVMPMINTFVFIIITFAQRVPHIHNYLVKLTAENISRQYQNSIDMLRCIRFVTTIQLSYITFATVETALGRMNGLGTFFIPVTLVFIFSVLIFFVIRSYRLK